MTAGCDGPDILQVCARTGWNGWNWLEMAGTDQKWLELAGNGWKWKKQQTKWLEMAGDGWKWMTKMIVMLENEMG